jgi:putative ABC transport system ATP-binding protein
MSVAMTHPLPQLSRWIRVRRDEAARPAGPAGAGVEVDCVSRNFGEIKALREVSLSVAPGELLVVTGRSGSGKSTLLNLISGLDEPSAGRVLIDGEAVWQGPHVVRARRELVGLVFQQHLLLGELTAQANVEVPLLGSGVPRRERHRRALELLEEVGVSHRAEHLPSMMSGGERQRVAVARALANSPRLLLADEPTGSLDSVNAARIIDLLVRLRDRRGMTVIVVSYDPVVGTRADRTVTLLDGCLDSAGHRPPDA